MLNQIVLMGRLTRAPEIRYTDACVPVASFTLAVERDYGKKDERQTDFIDIVAWRNTAEFVSKYFTKGQLVAVTGRLQIRDWTDADGHKRRNAEVVADRVYFAEGKRDRDQRNDDSAGYSAPPAEYNDPPRFEDYNEDDGNAPF